MSEHSHQFVESYSGLVGFGLDRKTNENTLIYYLQKFSDDDIMGLLRERLSNSEIEDLFGLLNQLMKRHMSEEEYHLYFLKEGDGSG
ncbi:MAG: hypothetical protein V2J25_03245 [Desulfatiglans sp.]|jgi:hypothetical protein|nr:hypothetical protein [Desulfatiglans sp.]